MTLTSKSIAEYRVDVTFDAPGQPNGQRVQSFGHSDLDSMWRTINAYRGKANVKRIRVYALLAVFEV